MFKHSRLKYNFELFSNFSSNCFKDNYDHNSRIHLFQLRYISTYDHNSHMHDVYKTHLHHLLLDDASCLIMRTSHFMICFQRHNFSILFDHENITFFNLFSKIRKNDTIFSWHSNSQRTFFESFNISQNIVSQYKSILIHENIMTKKITFLLYIFRVSFDFKFVHI